MWSTVRGNLTFSTINGSGKQNQGQSLTMIEQQYLGPKQKGSVEGHELASLWPHPWPWRQVYSEPKRCAHLQPTHPRPHLDQDPKISCLLTGSAQASSLNWSSQGQTTPSLFITLVPRHSQRAAVWKVYGLEYPHMYTGKQGAWTEKRFSDWRLVLSLHFATSCSRTQESLRILCLTLI